MKICETCNKSFSPVRSDARFCSRECVRHNKTCKTCGSSFITENARKAYCSAECRHGVGECLQCGTQFVKTPRTTGQFCSLECWYTHYDAKNQKECAHCGKEFASGRQSKYCSAECASNSRKNYMVCQQCGKEFQGKRSRKYCSHSCALTGINRKGHRRRQIGDTVPHSKGYVQVKVGYDYPGANKSGYILAHRLAIQEHIGRVLEPHERIHHKNGDRSDNRIENLELWAHATKKDPSGVRLLDKAKDLCSRMLPEDRKALVDWLISNDI